MAPKRRASVKKDADPEGPPKLSRTRTMQETQKAAKEFLEKLGHEVHAPLAKTANQVETRSKHKMRTAVEILLSSSSTKKETMSEEEVEQYKKNLDAVFRLIDAKKEGSIDKDQLLSAMRSLGKRPRTEKVEKIMEEAGKKNPGKISHEEFVSYMLSKKDIKEDEEEEPKEEPKEEVAVDLKEKGKEKEGEKEGEEEEVQPLCFSVLNRKSSIMDFYTENAGMYEAVAGYESANFDLGKENAFSSFSILMMNFNKKAPLSRVFDFATTCLKEKGFQVVSAETEDEFLESVDNFDEVWIASADAITKKNKQVYEKVKAFRDAGKGVGVWGGGEPLTYQANAILKHLTGVTLVDSHLGTGTMKMSEDGEAKEKGSLARGLLTTGITDLQEGTTYAHPDSEPANMTVVGRSNLGLPCLLAWEGSANEGRVFVDCSLVNARQRLFGEGQFSAEKRFISNVAVWLLGLENRMKLGKRLVGDIKVDDSVTWEYFLPRPQDGKKAGFHPYSEEACKLVEAGFQKFLKSSQADNNIRAYLTVQSGQFTYEIDFKTMTQRNVEHPSHTVRKIRRIGGN